MALLRSIVSPKLTIPLASNGFRYIQTTAICGISMKWREAKGLHRNPNAHGPLTDLPDYTFMDGDRLTPLGSNQKKRIIKQRELAQKMVSFIKELDDAKVRHKRLEEEKEKSRQNIISNKFKPKGILLIKK